MQNQISSNWQKVKLREFADVKGGKRLPMGFSVQDQKTDHPYLRIVDMNEAGLDTSNIKYISDEVFKRISRYTISDKDLYISIAGTIGFVGSIPQFLSGANLTENCAKICNFSKELDRDFLLYFLKSYRGKAEIKAGTGGSSQPKLALHRIDSFQLLLPPIKIQQKIASILSSLDNKIEVNNKATKTMEEMAQTIFKEWFVKFKFPGYTKAKFVDSELGKIPEGWEIKNLKDIVDLIAIRYIGNNNEDRIPYLPIDLIQSKTLLLKEVAPAEEAKSSLIKFLENDILFGAMRPYFFKVSVAPFAGLSRATCFVLRPKTEDLFGYATFLIFRQETVDYATNLSQGSTIPYARWSGALAEMKLVKPSSKLLNLFNSIVIPIIGKIKSVYFENQKLSALRDLLLPRLMRGEIRV